jgi:hypothetical protein
MSAIDILGFVKNSPSPLPKPAPLDTGEYGTTLVIAELVGVGFKYEDTGTGDVPGLLPNTFLAPVHSGDVNDDATEYALDSDDDAMGSKALIDDITLPYNIVIALSVATQRVPRAALDVASKVLICSMNDDMDAKKFLTPWEAENAPHVLDTKSFALAYPLGMVAAPDMTYEPMDELFNLAKALMAISLPAAGLMPV